MSRAARAGEARTPCQNWRSSRSAFQCPRLGRCDHRGDEIEGQDAAAAHEHGGEEADPDQADVEAGVIGNAGANPEDLAVALVAIEAGAARRLLRIIFGNFGTWSAAGWNAPGSGIAVVGHLTHRPRAGVGGLRGRAGIAGASSGFSAVMMRSIVHRRSSSRRAASWSSSSNFSSPEVNVAAVFHLVM